MAAAAKTGFQILVTSDKKIRFEHNSARLVIAVVELRVLRNRPVDIAEQLAHHFEAAISATATHRFVSVHPHGVEVVEASRRP